MTTVAVVGLGYVGLPLAAAFGRVLPTIGFDLNEEKLSQYRTGLDPSGEVDSAAFAAAEHLEFTGDPARLGEATVVIVVVPTPIDEAHQPDLSPLQGACKTVATYLRPGMTVVFESTVYPGCTEEICVPILQAGSGLPWAGAPGAASDVDGFHVGYSPERINPGDKVHRLETITKVVSGDTHETLQRLAGLYEMVVEAGVHRAASIKVAEAAKVIENTQRDLNISLMNELALIFNRLEIDTLDVLEAAGTKWNFLPFRPGLVGGHCIGVDPYYLTHRAEAAGHHPQVILAGRQTNDGMGKFIAEQAIKRLAKTGKPIQQTPVTVLGLTFKENCPDLRNSRVIDVVDELREYGCDVQVHDPLADSAEARREYGLELVPWDELKPAGVLVLAVPHKDYLERDVDIYRGLLEEGATVMDVKCVLDRNACREAGLLLWRL